jgi:alkyl hydroperoxide reductase subunit F
MSATRRSAAKRGEQDDRDSAPVLPLPPEAPYDVHVVVVGAGPAGLSAAVRVRWIKSWHTVPCSVAIFESGRIGGLGTWRTASITGPGWRYTGDGFVQAIRRDVDRFNIPIVPERVVSIQPHGDGYVVRGSGGTELRCVSVVLATGMRGLANEVDYLGRGLFITYMGYGYFERLFERAAQAASGRGMIVVGTGHTTKLAALLEPHVARSGGLTFLLDEPDGDALAAARRQLPGRVVRGRLKRVIGEPNTRVSADVQTGDGPDLEPESVPGVTGIVWEGPDAAEHSFACGSVLLDYNAWELRPDTHWDAIGLSRSQGGAIAIDALCRTSAPGIFAAGDLAGDRFKATAIALGDGVTAGFGAVRHVHEGLFGAPLDLFAYAATDRPLLPGEPELPPLSGEHVPVLLAPLDGCIAALTAMGDEAVALARAMDGVATMADLTRHTGVTHATLQSILYRIFELKLGTVHRRKS